LQRLLTLENASLVAGDLPGALAASNEMLRGDDLDRAMGWYALGEIELLQGHFSAAREAWQSCVQKSRQLGAQGPVLQALEELASVEEFVGDLDSLRARLKSLLEFYDVNDRTRSAAHRIQLDSLAKPRVCPDLPALVASFTDGGGKATFERQIS